MTYSGSNNPGSGPFSDSTSFPFCSVGRAIRFAGESARETSRLDRESDLGAVAEEDCAAC